MVIEDIRTYEVQVNAGETITVREAAPNGDAVVLLGFDLSAAGAGALDFIDDALVPNVVAYPAYVTAARPNTTRRDILRQTAAGQALQARWAAGAGVGCYVRVFTARGHAVEQAEVT